MTNNDKSKVPEWLGALGIKEGEFFLDSKLRAKRAMKSACFSEAARIHIYLGLATMGFQQELAVKLEAGKRVPVQPVDICAATGIDRRNFRRHMNCLEAYGLAKIEGSTKGKFRVYAYAVPRPVEVDRIVINLMTMYNSFAGCSPDLKTLLNRYHVRIPSGFVADAMTIAELERLAAMTKQAELSLKRYVDCLPGCTRINKEERQERYIERKTPPPPSPQVVAEPAPGPKAEEEEESSNKLATFKNRYPPQQFDEAKTKPLWERLTTREKRRCLDRLEIYRECERWKRSLADDGGRWIPLASNWLGRYEADPDPYIHPRNGNSGHDETVERVLRLHEKWKKAGL